MVHITTNGRPVEVLGNTAIVEAAAQAEIKIPSLYHLKDVHAYGPCRICVAEVREMKNLQASCIAKIRENMVVETNPSRVWASRKVLYGLLLFNHPRGCLNCGKNQNCKLQESGYELGITESRFEGELAKFSVDISPSTTHDTNKCILYRRCVTVCSKIQHVGAIQVQNRGLDTVVNPAMGLPLNSVDCAMCGQRIVVYPTGILQETDGPTPVWKALVDPVKRTIVQVAPVMRAALGEELDLPYGTPVTGKIASVLHELGSDDIFDTLFAVDLTIMEEDAELLSRLDAVLEGGKAALPMITSCPPGWIKHVKHQFPEQLDHLSSCKSPHTMMGAALKSYYAEKIGVSPKDIFVVSAMPYTAKKYEVQRPEVQISGNPDVDAVLTTRKLARMIKSVGTDFINLPGEQFDVPSGSSTGTADIFGVTGGMIGAALRTVYKLVTDKELPFEDPHVTPIVGLEQIKIASTTIEKMLSAFEHLKGVTVNAVVASGLEGAFILMKRIGNGASLYHFIEVMGCPGGYVSGGGQPRATEENFRQKRSQALYSEDGGKTFRGSHEGPDLQQFYQKYLGELNGHRAHEPLHTHYVKRGRFNELV